MKKYSQLDICVEKNSGPILVPDFERYKSIRNPAGFRYDGKIGLLSTVRYMDERSLLHLAWSNDGENFKLEDKPFIGLDNDSVLGVEDARVSKIGEEYFITFTNYKDAGENYNTTRVGLIRTNDFKNILERKIILDEYENNKNCAVFGKNDSWFYVIHRPFKGGGDERAFARIAKTQDFNNFEDLGSFLQPTENSWENARVGINTPPIKISHPEFGETLFSIYHGATIKDNVYSMGYIVMDADNPKRVLERSEKPLLSPELDWEIGKGNYSAEVANVVFGCGVIPMSEDVLRIYYAGADRYTGFADVNFKNACIMDLE